MAGHPYIVDFLRRRLASDSWVRPYAKWIVEDLRSILRTGQTWSQQEEDTPECVFVETTNICNANCVFCAYRYQDAYRTGKGVMTDAVFEKVLVDYGAMPPLRSGGSGWIELTPMVGEALVDPSIIRRVKRAKEMGFGVAFHTNGLLLNRVDLAALLATKIDGIRVSTAPFDRQSHEMIYQTRGKYDDLCKGLQRLLMLRNELDSATELTLLFRANIPLTKIVGLPDFQEMILPHLRKTEIARLYAQVAGFDTWGGQIRQSDLPLGMRIALPPRLKHRPCASTFLPQVMYDGKVRACACRFAGQETQEQDGLLVGDIQRNSLDEIWVGPAIRELRRGFLRGNLPRSCRSCTMYRSV